MRYLFMKMQRIRIIVILVIVLLIVTAYWLMTSSPKRPKLQRIQNNVYLGKGKSFNQGLDTGRLGRKGFPNSPDSKVGKSANVQWNARKEQMGHVFKKPSDLKIRHGIDDRRANQINPGGNQLKINFDEHRQQFGRKESTVAAEKKIPSKNRKLNPSVDSSVKDKFAINRDRFDGGVSKDKNKVDGGYVINKNKVKVGGKSDLDKDPLPRGQNNLNRFPNDLGNRLDKKTFFQDKSKKPVFGDGTSQNALNRNNMMDEQMKLDRKQLKEALQKDRTNFKRLDGRLEAFARSLGVIENVFYQNKKYENKPGSNVSPIPHRMGPPEAYILTTTRRPKAKFMPSVGNGHVATVVDSDTVLMNGLYTGIGNVSHRARIPSMTAFEISEVGPNKLQLKRNFSLNMLEGIYTETMSAEGLIMEKRTYAHRSIPNVLVSELDVFRMPGPGQTAMQLVIKNLRGSISGDIIIVEGKCTLGMDCVYIHGKTSAYEHPSSPQPEMHAYYDQIPQKLEVPAVPVGHRGIRMRWIFTASIATNKQEAETNYRLAGELIAKAELLSQHRSSWMNLWSEGAITMVGNLAISRAAFSALYYTYSSLPSIEDPARPFYGLSPTDLAHGDLVEDYSGRIKSDQEIWMFPNILMLQSDIARHLIKSRMMMQTAAQQNARDNGYVGTQFPAESAYSGIEVGPPESKHEIHPSGDIAFAIQQYLYMTKDINFYDEGVKPLLIDIAHFYQNRISFNNTNLKYTFKDVLSLDKKRGKVADSVYTNAIAKIALSAPYVLSTYFGLKSDDSEKWYSMANKSLIPFEKTAKFHPMDNKYKMGMRISQPEALMLRYPLMQDVSLAGLRKDVSIYERGIDGPAKAWITLAMAYMQLKDFEAGWSKLKGTMMNIQPPFQVWTESSTGGGAKNYLTLAGGFLQAILNGYAGFRIKRDRLEFDPTLPPKVTTLNISSVDYMGSAFDFKITQDNIMISMVMTKYSAPKFKVVVYATGSIHFIKMHQAPVVIPRKKAAIFPLGSPKLGRPLSNDAKVKQQGYPTGNKVDKNVDQVGQINPRVSLGQQQRGYPTGNKVDTNVDQVGQINPRVSLGQQQRGQGKPSQNVQQPGFHAVPNLNQQRFDSQANSQPIPNQAPRSDVKVSGRGDAPLGVGPENKNFPGRDMNSPSRGKNLPGRDMNLPGRDVDVDLQNSERFQNLKQRLKEKKIELERGRPVRYPDGRKQPGIDVFNKDPQKLQFKSPLDDKNKRPLSALNYDNIKKEPFAKKQGFESMGQKKEMKRKLRKKRREAGLQ